MMVYILKETSKAKSELVLLEWTTCLYQCFVLYDMRIVNTFNIVYRVMNYSLLMPKLVSFYAKLKNMNFISRWKFLSVYLYQVS